MKSISKTLLLVSSFFLCISADSWKNKSTQILSNTQLVTQSGGASVEPNIVEQEVGGKLPAMVFDGDDFFDYDGSKLKSSDFTIFVVEQRNSSQANNYFIGTQAGSQLKLGYKTDESIVFGYNGNEDFIIGVAPFSNKSPIIHTFVLDPTIGKKYYQNGNLVATSANTDTLINNSGGTIGRDNSNYFDGSILEIAMYSRALLDSEISEIEDYLAKKWSVHRPYDNINAACDSNSAGYGLIATNAIPSGATTASSGASIALECDSGFSGSVNDLNCLNGIWSGGSGSCLVSTSCDENLPSYVAPAGLDIIMNSGTWYKSDGTTQYDPGAMGTIANTDHLEFGCDGEGTSGGHIGGTVSNLVCSAGTWTGGVSGGSPECL